MSAQLAEAWYQALRAWRVRVVRLPRPRPWRPRGAWVARRPGICPVCRSANAAMYDAMVEGALMRGENPRRVIRRIASELGVKPHLVELHVSAHLASDPPTPLVGEWTRGGVEYVELPIGWRPSSRVMAAIQAHPEAPLLLAVVRREIRRRTLLHHGRYRDEAARKIGQALLSLAEALAAG